MTDVDPWLYIPFIVFGAVTTTVTILLYLVKKRFFSSFMLGAFIGTGAMLILRGFQVDPECIHISVVDTIESTIVIVVGSAVSLHYGILALRDTPRRSVLSCCEREDDILTPTYPPGALSAETHIPLMEDDLV